MCRYRTAALAARDAKVQRAGTPRSQLMVRTSHANSRLRTFMASRLHYPRHERRYSVTCPSAFRNCLSATTPSRASFRDAAQRGRPMPRACPARFALESTPPRISITTMGRNYSDHREYCDDMSQRCLSAQRHPQVRLLGVRRRDQASLTSIFHEAAVLGCPGVGAVVVG